MKLSIGPLGALTGVLTVIIGLTGCSSSDSMERPTGMASATSMSQDPEKSGAWVYPTPNANLRRYTRFIVEPVEVYQGPEVSLGSMTNSQITKIAQYLKSEARRELGSSYGVPSQPGPNTARIAMKLVGFEQTVSGAATVSRIVPMGAVANAVQGAPAAADRSPARSSWTPRSTTPRRPSCSLPRFADTTRRFSISRRRYRPWTPHAPPHVRWLRTCGPASIASRAGRPAEYGALSSVL